MNKLLQAFNVPTLSSILEKDTKKTKEEGGERDPVSLH